MLSVILDSLYTKKVSGTFILFFKEKIKMTRYHKPIDFCSYNIETVFDEMPLNAESVYHLTVDLLGFRLIPIMNGEEPTSWDQIDELEVQARDCLKAVLDQDAYWYGEVA
jgi:hypothetical protein